MGEDLKAIGYPVTTFQPALDLFEEKVLSRVDKLSAQDLDQLKKSARIAVDHGPFEKAYRKDAQVLASNLNAYRDATKPTISKIMVAGGECGAGGLTVTITTDPRGGQISIIPTFFYDLCRAQNLNVYDSQSCDDGEKSMMGSTQTFPVTIDIRSSGVMEQYAAARYYSALWMERKA